MSQTNGDSNMAKKKHSKSSKNSSSNLKDQLITGLGRMQRNFKTATALIPWKKSVLLTTPEPHGPDMEYFRNPQLALQSWSNKQLQTWKFSGVLKTEADRTLAFELDFHLRQTEQDRLSVLPLRWIKPQVFSASFTITDPLNAKKNQTFMPAHKGGFLNSLTGFAAEDRFHVDVGGWFAKRNSDGTFSIYASEDGNALNLLLTPAKPMAYHAQRGFMQKDTDANYSAYSCSYSQLQAKGTLILGQKLHEIRGMVCLDHEKMTLPEKSELSKGIVTDRLWIPLPSSEELILEIHYDDEGHLNHFTTGSYIDAQGNVSQLISTDMRLETSRFWKSKATQSRYPVKRSLHIFPLQMGLEINPIIDDQEIDSFFYTLQSRWDGMVSVKGKRKGEGFETKGRMSLNGYDPRKKTKLLRSFTQI